VVNPDWYEIPVFYFTNPAAVHPAAADVRISPGSNAFDYELEIAAVIGNGGSDLDPNTADEHIAGYMLLCDWSARDLQAREMRQMLGPAKGKDSATSFGPFLVTPDELADHRSGNAYDISMRAYRNGELYSSGNLADLYWSFGQMLAYASREPDWCPATSSAAARWAPAASWNCPGYTASRRIPISRRETPFGWKLTNSVPSRPPCCPRPEPIPLGKARA